MKLFASAGRRVAAATAALLSALAPALAATDDGHVAFFKSVNGHVHVLRQGQSLDARAGMQLFVADELASDAGATAGVVFRDGTLLTVGAGSDVRVRDYVFDPSNAKYAFSLYLSKGSAIYSSGRIGKLSPESVKVETPTATVGVRGTRFLIEAR